VREKKKENVCKLLIKVEVECLAGLLTGRLIENRVPAELLEKQITSFI
jgi:hypothetical protein